MGRAVFYTVRELWERGSGSIPDEFISGRHLIYSSPATLSFNSPGAEGFGVKRAGLSVPGSVMLIVSPGCCGRNTSSISTMPGYENRFFYLTMNETDLITGRHLTRIPKAVCNIVDSLREPPSVVMICITCVDALLGTDMERVCRKAEEVLRTECPRAGEVRVRPCYMYALTREGRRPPMVHVRQSIYSLLEPMKKRAASVNILGYFAPLASDCELPALLGQAGVRRVREISACGSYEEFMKMAEANFNLVLNPEARPAAQDLEERLGIPSIELMRLYRTDRIAAQYDALAAVLGTTFDYGAQRARAEESLERFQKACPDAVFSVGEALNADPFEMALSLTTYGFRVAEIFGTVTADSFRFLRRLAQLSPETKVYSNLSPSMMHYDRSDPGGDTALIALGRDAGWYHPGRPCLNWADDRQPFGFAAVRDLFDALTQTVETGRTDLHNDGIRIGPAAESKAAAEAEVTAESGLAAESNAEEESKAAAEAGGGTRTGAGSGQVRRRRTKGYRSVLTPFAPDQSGAVCVLYALGGMTVICDAGGCTGNICGFDETRWFTQQSAVFSAGLRDMDAILGRDRELVDKMAMAADVLDVRMAAVIGTPVPAVIGTDFRALSRMTENRTGLPAIGVPCDGMHDYDKGVSDTYLALLERFCDADAGKGRTGSQRIGVWGGNAIDAYGIWETQDLRGALTAPGSGTETVVFGEAAEGTDAFVRAADVQENLVVTVSGLAAAKWIKKRFGIPFRCANPAVEEKVRGILGRQGTDASRMSTAKILIVHEQITANAVRSALCSAGAARVDVATFFDMADEIARPDDKVMREETDFTQVVSEGGYDEIWADAALKPLLPAGSKAGFVELPHFAVSGSRQGGIHW